tara:strand:+ start:240 stop:848 length:609 start_codon:yes stop_codon:yes gene_type:complete
MNIFRKSCKVISVVFALTSQTEAFGTINFGISGAGSENNVGLEKHKSTSLSGSINLNLGSFFRIGYSQRQAFEDRGGLKTSQLDDGSIVYYEFKEKVQTITNSINLTLVLYNGRVSPYIFGGVARKDYEITNAVSNLLYTKNATLYPVPTYGVGASIFVSRHFNFKMTQTWSPGVKITIKDNAEVEEPILDSYLQVGINYAI